MTTATKRRRRKARIADPMDIAPTPKRQPNGQKRRAEDARATAKAARERHTGLIADDALQPVHGTELGSCINHLCKPDERPALIQVWNAMSQALLTWRMRNTGNTGHPQGAAIAMVPDRMETDQSLRVDLRTADERNAAARRAYDGWMLKIALLPTPQHRWAIKSAVFGFFGEASLWRDQAPTGQGRAAVDALRRMAK